MQFADAGQRSSHSKSKLSRHLVSTLTSHWQLLSYTWSTMTFKLLDLILSLFSNYIHVWNSWDWKQLRGYCTPGPYFWRLCAFFSKNKATSDKISYGSGQKCSKELKHHSFTSVETIVVKLQWKMCENQYFPCFEP